MIGQQQGADWSYFGYDGLGSVRQMLDSTGGITYAASFDPYGLPLEQAGLNTNLGFTGEYTDPSGLLYLRARYYNPTIGTFTARDPVLGIMGRAMSYNGFSYVEGNPINWIDLSGLYCMWGQTPTEIVSCAVSNFFELVPHGIETSLKLINYVLIRGDYSNEPKIRSVTHQQYFHNIGVWWQSGGNVQVLGMIFPVVDLVDIGRDAANGEEIGVLDALSALDALQYLKYAPNWGRAVDAAIPDEAARGMARFPLQCPNSFSADTPVTTEDGDVPISELEVGDEVLAYNETTSETGEYTITDTISHVDTVVVHLVIDGELIETTPEHPFYTLGGEWVEAEDLEIGDLIWSLDGDYGAVESIELIDTEQRMYNLTVDEAHTFYVGDGDWLVHNCPVQNLGGGLPGREWQWDESSGIYRLHKDFDQFVTLPDGRIVVAKSTGIAGQNAAYAGRNFPLPERAIQGLTARYGNQYDFARGVDFTTYGIPIFDPYVIRANDGRLIEVPIDMLGTSGDFARADRAAREMGLRLDNHNAISHSVLGIWHHVEDGKTMQYVLQRLHAQLGHFGGEGVVRYLRALGKLP